MKIMGSYLMIGYFDGSFDLITLQNKKIAKILSVKAKADSQYGFVRDIYVKQVSNGDLYLLGLFVDQDEKRRAYSMGHFVISTSQDLKLTRSSEVVSLYSVPNSDKVPSKLQHRCEFYWWEQFRCLGSTGVAVPYGKGLIGILDLQKCHAEEVFVKAHSAITG
jgi:hypothetical protein